MEQGIYQEFKDEFFANGRSVFRVKAENTDSKSISGRSIVVVFQFILGSWIWKRVG